MFELTVAKAGWWIITISKWLLVSFLLDPYFLSTRQMLTASWGEPENALACRQVL